MNIRNIHYKTYVENDVIRSRLYRQLSQFWKNGCSRHHPLYIYVQTNNTKPHNFGEFLQLQNGPLESAKMAHHTRVSTLSPFSKRAKQQQQQQQQQHIRPDRLPGPPDLSGSAYLAFLQKKCFFLEKKFSIFSNMSKNTQLATAFSRVYQWFSLFFLPVALALDLYWRFPPIISTKSSMQAIKPWRKIAIFTTNATFSFFS